MSGSITRAEFEKKCIEFVEAHRQPVDNAYLISMLDGWEWVSHSLTGYGHLHRQRTFASHPLKPAGDMEEDATINEEEDTAAIHTHQSAELITVHEYVVFSATYQLPAYCFNVFKSDGNVLSIDEIMQSGFLSPQSIPLMKQESFAAIARMDHPTLPISCWCIHPCETAKSMEELLAEASRSGSASSYLDSWFAILSTAVCFPQ